MGLALVSAGAAGPGALWRSLGARAMDDGWQPLLPDGDEAREWAERELQREVYRAAEPTPLDRIARSVVDWVSRLFAGNVDGNLGSIAAALIVALVVALLIVSLILWGKPRAITGASAAFAPLFGEREDRTAAELRAAAARAATHAEWHEAIVLRTRALARGLQERGLVDPPPGATVHAFANAAAAVFPAHRPALARAAEVFDDVRYLGRPATQAGYAEVSTADEAVAAAPAPRAASAPAQPQPHEPAGAGA